MSKMTKTITLSESEIRTLIQSAVRARLLNEAAPALGKEQSTAGLDEGTVAALGELVDEMSKVGAEDAKVSITYREKKLIFKRIESDAGDFAGSYRLSSQAILPRRGDGGYPIDSIYDVTTSLILKGLNQEDVRVALQGSDPGAKVFNMRVNPGSDYANAGISGLRLARDKDFIFSISPIYSAWHVAKLVVMGSDVTLDEKPLADFPEIVAAIQKIVPAEKEAEKK